MPQTTDQVDGVYVAARDAVVGRLQPQPYDRRIVLSAVTGPTRSTLTVYRGYVATDAGALTTVYPADARTYDSLTDSGPMVLYAGEAATFEWTGGNVAVGQTARAAVRSQWGRG